MARAIWKGVIRMPDVELPVKLYSAIEEQGVHFRLLHAKDKAPVKQQMVNPATGEVVPPERIRRGYEVEKGVYVELADEELEALQPEPSRDIEITRFVEPQHISHQWYERPYWLGPDGDEAGDDYFALARALGERGVEGVARWVMRKKSYVGALRAAGDYLMLVSLRHAEEVVPASALEPPGGRKPDEREIRMARQLVDALATDFDPASFQDEYRERVLELVQTKAEGGTVELKEFRPKRPSDESLAKALEKSIAKAREKRSAA